MAGEKHFNLFELARQEKGRYLTRIDEVNLNEKITGIAARGTLNSQAAWLLQRDTRTGNVWSTEYADDAQFTQVWDDRYTVFGSAGSSTPVDIEDLLKRWPINVFSVTTTTDKWQFYSDLAKTDLILTVTITYTSSTKEQELETTRV